MGSPFTWSLSISLFLFPKLECYMLFWFKEKIDEDGCSYFKTFLFLRLVLIKLYGFVVAKVNLEDIRAVY